MRPEGARRNMVQRIDSCVTAGLDPNFPRILENWVWRVPGHRGELELTMDDDKSDEKLK